MRKTPEMAALFAEMRQPKHAKEEDVRGQLRPILTFVANVQRQVTEDRAALLEAELSADDYDTARGLLERLKQTDEAIDSDLRTLVDTSRRLMQSMAQRTRYANEIEASVDKLDQEERDRATRGGGPQT